MSATGSDMGTGYVVTCSQHVGDEWYASTIKAAPNSGGCMKWGDQPGLWLYSAGRVFADR